MDTRTAEPATVGEMLLEEFMLPKGLSLDELAADVGITLQRFESILSNEGVLSDEEARLLGDYLGTGGDFWRSLRDSHLRWRERMANAN
ncbi:addiction module antidote protein, HigA family (plasmid) [Enterobacteriaceae bacterium Kacie_13]|nr:addiction module antidote protein, HigA family [Enterobacteriaceae bacterium Kacie_13]